MFEASERAREGDVAYFKAMPTLELSSLLVGRDEDGRTLLHTAAAQGYMELLELLISAGSAKVLNKHDDEVGHAVVVYSCTPRACPLLKPVC